MKRVTFLILISFLTFQVQAQNLKYPNENADTLKHNSIGMNVSPIIANFIIGYNFPEQIPEMSLIYKHYNKKFNFRTEISFLPDITEMNGGTVYLDENGKRIHEIYFQNGETVKMNDTVVMKRFDYNKSYDLSLKTGIEKSKKTRMGTWYFGGGLYLGYTNKNDTYFYREVANTDTLDFNLNFTEYKYLNPNTEAPYYKGKYFKIGINFFTGYEWRLTKHLNISAEVNPSIFYIGKFTESLYDNNNYLQKMSTGINPDLGFIRIIASLKF